MIAIISCGHRPDDERIYTREIKSLLKAGHKITYFTRWEKDTNLSEENLWHRNYIEKRLPRPGELSSRPAARSWYRIPEGPIKGG